MRTYAWRLHKELWDPQPLSVNLANRPSVCRRGRICPTIDFHSLLIFLSATMTGSRDHVTTDAWIGSSALKVVQPDGQREEHLGQTSNKTSCWTKIPSSSGFTEPLFFFFFFFFTQLEPFPPRASF